MRERLLATIPPVMQQKADEVANRELTKKDGFTAEEIYDQEHKQLLRSLQNRRRLHRQKRTAEKR